VNGAQKNQQADPAFLAGAVLADRPLVAHVLEAQRVRGFAPWADTAGGAISESQTRATSPGIRVRRPRWTIMSSLLPAHLMGGTPREATKPGSRLG
jgi:hypothetical protein